MIADAVKYLELSNLCELVDDFSNRTSTTNKHSTDVDDFHTSHR
jgi:hypothetical protein